MATTKNARQGEECVNNRISMVASNTDRATACGSMCFLRTGEIRLTTPKDTGRESQRWAGDTHIWNHCLPVGVGLRKRLCPSEPTTRQNGLQYWCSTDRGFSRENKHSPMQQFQRHSRHDFKGIQTARVGNVKWLTETQIGFKIFLNITPTVTNWTADNKSFSLLFDENPLADFVELPDDGRAQDELWFSNILCGVLRGALEMVSMSDSVFSLLSRYRYKCL